jgi:hypothetical protein
VQLVGDGFLACTKHGSVDHWLVYDSTTAVVIQSSTDCV